LDGVRGLQIVNSSE